jgi:hypothetical protein
MANALVKWCVSFLVLFLSNSSFGYGEDESDNPLILPENELERLVSMTGMLGLRILKYNPEDELSETYQCWILKLSPESFEVACKTPVRACFQTPESIRSSWNCNEMQLTSFDEHWLKDHLNQKVTLEGYLWHAHTHSHHTPILMDIEPWLSIANLATN